MEKKRILIARISGLDVPLISNVEFDENLNIEKHHMTSIIFNYGKFIIINNTNYFKTRPRTFKPLY